MNTIISIGSTTEKPCRDNKGKSVLLPLSDFTVIDLETTGLDPLYDEIIEIGAIRYRAGVEAEVFSSLVRPEEEIDEFISDLTGITNEMLKDAPPIGEILPAFLAFTGEDTVVGHNVNFDINFIYDAAAALGLDAFSNDYLDTMRLSRRLFPEERHHRLKDMVQRFGIDQAVAHRAVDDCRATAASLIYMYDHINEAGIEFSSLLPKRADGVKAADIIATDNAELDPTHPLYGKKCVFTGTLERMQRKDAMQLVVNIGGLCGDGVTKDTNFLILGNNDYCKSIKDGKSNKQKKAEDLKRKGHDIEILTENVFYSMFED